MNKPILDKSLSITRGALPGSRKLMLGGVPFRGGNAFTLPPTHWEADVDPSDNREACARHQFSLNTCNGCHFGDTSTFFLHVDPTVMPAALSNFLTGGGGGVWSVPDPQFGTPSWTFADLERRFDEQISTANLSAWLERMAGRPHHAGSPHGKANAEFMAGLLRADAGSVVICGVDQRAQPLAAKRLMGVLPDRLRTFDRLTGRQLLFYYGLLRGLDSDVIEKRVGDLARAFDLGDALSRVVSDYSAGMTKKIMLAGALIHSPRVLVLDEPFEAVDPVSSAVILDILRAYVAHGGTVILSSHGMDLVERVCSRVAIIVGGDVLADGAIDEVRAGQTLEARFVELSGGVGEVEGLEWLHTFSD